MAHHVLATKGMHKPMHRNRHLAHSENWWHRSESIWKTLPRIFPSRKKKHTKTDFSSLVCLQTMHLDRKQLEPPSGPAELNRDSAHLIISYSWWVFLQGQNDFYEQIYYLIRLVASPHWSQADNSFRYTVQEHDRLWKLVSDAEMAKRFISSCWVILTALFGFLNIRNLLTDLHVFAILALFLDRSVFAYIASMLRNASHPTVGL